MNISAYNYVPPGSITNYGNLGRTPQQQSLDSYISTQNPYKNQTTGLADNIGDFTSGLNWINNQVSRQNGQRFNVPTGSWGGGSPSATNPNQTYGPINNNPAFGLVKVSKDPTGQYDATNSSYLSTINGSNPDYSGTKATLGTLSTATNNQNITGNQAVNQADTQSLIDKYKSMEPSLDAQTASQTNSLNSIYAPASDPNSLAAKYAANTRLASSAANQAASRAASQAYLRSRIANHGGAGSSYGDAQLADTVGQIGERVATANAERVRQDTSNLLNAQTSNIGRSQDVNSTNILRGNIPIQARNNQLDQSIQQVAGQLQNAGKTVDLQNMTDSLAVVGRKLGLTGEALQQYLSQNFFGVQKQGVDYPLNISGFPSYRPQPQSFYPTSGAGRDPNYLAGLPLAQQPVNQPGTANDFSFTNDPENLNAWYVPPANIPPRIPNTSDGYIGDLPQYYAPNASNINYNGPTSDYPNYLP